MTKRIEISFADPRMIFQECQADLLNGIEQARWNLASKHSVDLVRAYILENSVVVELSIPDDKVEGFNYGYHLRGIALYLRRIDQDKYKICFDGRLLNYKEVQ